jgi:hypothetical protein
MGSLYLHYMEVVRSKMCTDTPLVPAWLPPPNLPGRTGSASSTCLLECAVLARHLPRCTVTPSSLQRGLVVRIDYLPAILHDARERDFSPVVQYDVYNVYATLSFVPTVPTYYCMTLRGW